MNTPAFLEDMKCLSTGGWAVPHNQTLMAVRTGTRLADGERAILGLAYGLWAWSKFEGADDGFGGPNVTWPLFQAFSDALNFDLGRLDGGTLSTWACELLTKLGINPDTGDWLPES